MDIAGIEKLFQLGLAGAIAVYLVWFLANRVIKSQDKMAEALEKVLDRMEDIAYYLKAKDKVEK